ncbi:MAG: hypothetical protein ACRED5_12990 [Propylenella sp.]
MSTTATEVCSIHHQATLKKVVSDRRASLDDETEVRPEIRRLVESEFGRGAAIPVVAFPADSAAIPDSPRLTLAIADPETEWRGDGEVVQRVAEWIKTRGKSDRLYPGALIWCTRKPDRELQECVETWLAWKRVASEVNQGLLGAEYDRADKAEVHAKVKDAEEAAKDQVWAGYRFVALADAKSPSGVKVIDLGAGHSSSSETLCGRVIAALKAEALLNENVGAGYIERHWPPAFQETGAWPLTGLRQSFLNGSLTRLIDPDTVLRRRIVEFVTRGDFGLASGVDQDGGFERVWFGAEIDPAEVAFEPNVVLLAKKRAQAAKAGQPQGPTLVVAPPETEGPGPYAEDRTTETTSERPQSATLRITGTIPPEVWNRLGTRLIPKLRSAVADGADLRIEVEFIVVLRPGTSNVRGDVAQALEDLGLKDVLRLDNQVAHP